MILRIDDVITSKGAQMLVRTWTITSTWEAQSASPCLRGHLERPITGDLIR